MILAADAELLAVFKAEIQEQLDNLGQLLAERPEEWAIVDLFRIAHNVKGAARMVEVGPVRDAAHPLEDLLAALRDGLPRSEQAGELAIEGARLLQRCFEAFDSGTEAPDVEPYAQRVRDFLLAAVESQSQEDAAASPVLQPNADDVRGESAPSDPAPPTEKASPPDRPLGRSLSSETLRVGVAKIDKLMGLASEFIMSVYGNQDRQQVARDVVASLLELARRHPQIKDLAGFQDVVHDANQMRRGLLQDAVRNEQLSDQLQESIRSLRMVRIDNLRSLFSRIVRDAAGTTGNSARLTVEGGDTEIDRAILDSLRDPIVHLLRNAVAHGLKGRNGGPDGPGNVVLSARAAGVWVEIAVSDDGRGISVDEVRQHAIERGVLTPAEATSLDHDAIIDLIFGAGFSTVAVADEVSGRGVGLDVVRRNLTDLGGHVSVETEVGKGTTFNMRVPLTRLTTKGIVVRLGEHFFAAPLISVERTLFVLRDAIDTVDGQDVIMIDEHPVPVIGLESVMRLKSESRERRPALVLSGSGRRRAFLVDEVLGQREFIIQQLSWNLRNVAAVAGATVLDQGRIVMILDANELLGMHAAVRLSVANQASVTEDRHRRVLLVDDSVTSRTLEKNILGSAGYDVITAVDGEEAWSRLQETDIDLVVTDVEMPRLDGLGLTRRIRSDADLAELGVILVTSRGREEDRDAGAEAGANAYVVKGAFDQDALLKAVARLI